MITFQIRRSASSKPVVVHYDRLKSYLVDRYQPVGQFEDDLEERAPGQATGHSVGDDDVDGDDDNGNVNDCEQDQEETFFTPDGGSPENSDDQRWTTDTPARPVGGPRVDLRINCLSSQCFLIFLGGRELVICRGSCGGRNFCESSCTEPTPPGRPRGASGE